MARNLLQVAAALVQTKAWLCRDLKNTDLKVRFCGHYSGVVDFSPLEGICSHIMDANMVITENLWCVQSFYDTRRCGNAGSELHC